MGLVARVLRGTAGVLKGCGGRGAHSGVDDTAGRDDDALRHDMRAACGIISVQHAAL